MNNENNNSDPSTNETKSPSNSSHSPHDILYMDSIERIKLIGTISDCDTQTLLNAYIDILGIESLRPFLLTTFFKSIPQPSPINRNKKNKSLIPPPLPSKTQKLLTKTIIKNAPYNPNTKTKKSTKSQSKSHIKNGRNFASKSPVQLHRLHSTNQPLPSRTTPAHDNLQTNATIISQSNIQLSSHNNAIINDTHKSVIINGYVPQPIGNGHSSEKEEEKQDICDKDKHRDNRIIIPAPVVNKNIMHFDISLPIKVELLSKKRIDKYFNLLSYPQDLKLFGEYGELPDDIYMKIFSWLDFNTVMNGVKLVSRSWFNIASQSSSIGHFKCVLPINDTIEMDMFQFINRFDILWNNNDQLNDRWSVYNKLLNKCCKINMRDIKMFHIRFHDFSFYSFNKHPLKRLLIKQRCLCKLQLNAILHWKEHDISDCLGLLLQCKNVLYTLKIFIIDNFIINPSREELIEFKSNNGMENDMILKSAKILGDFLCKCKQLETFRWYYTHVNKLYTCYGIYIAFVLMYFKGKNYNIRDLQLPSFPISYKHKEVLLYNDIINKLLLNRLYYKGDLSIINWNGLATIEYLSLCTTRVTNASFTDCFLNCKSLKYLSINTTSLATTGWYQNDELSNFITPYFRCKNLNKLQKIEINVKFLEEKSLFAFLLKCKYAIGLKLLCINGQSFNGQLKNDDIRKYIGQFISKSELIFRLSIKSQFYSSLRVLQVIKGENGKGIYIDKDKWRKKNKKFKMKDNVDNIHNELDNIHNSVYPT